MHNIILGQGLLCDLTSLVLTKSSAKTFFSHETSKVKIIGSFILSFFEYLSVSLCIGFVFGIFGCLCLKYIRSLTLSATHETFFMFMVCFVSYATGDLAKASGVVAILVTSVMFAIYGWYNLSPQGKQVSGSTFSFLAYAAESLVFVSIALTLFD